MPALIAIFRMAVPFAATLFGGYFISDVFNERQKAKAAQAQVNYPRIIGGSLKAKAGFWKFVAIAGLLVGALIVLIQKIIGK